MKFWKKEKGEDKPGAGKKSFQDFLDSGRIEMERLMAQDREWFYHLPYQGAMSLEEAKNLEIEKRAIWRRVIYDAQRTKLAGLRWETRLDELVCQDCQKMDGRIFSRKEYVDLDQRVMHVGCRCNLVAVRE
jgi:hypothetical protein